MSIPAVSCLLRAAAIASDEDLAARLDELASVMEKTLLPPPEGFFSALAHSLCAPARGIDRREAIDELSEALGHKWVARRRGLTAAILAKTAPFAEPELRPRDLPLPTSAASSLLSAARNGDRDWAEELLGALLGPDMPASFLRAVASCLERIGDFPMPEPDPARAILLRVRLAAQNALPATSNGVAALAQALLERSELGGCAPARQGAHGASRL